MGCDSYFFKSALACGVFINNDNIFEVLKAPLALDNKLRIGLFLNGFSMAKTAFLYIADTLEEFQTIDAPGPYEFEEHVVIVSKAKFLKPSQDQVKLLQNEYEKLVGEKPNTEEISWKLISTSYADYLDFSPEVWEGFTESDIQEKYYDLRIDFTE